VRIENRSFCSTQPTARRVRFKSDCPAPRIVLQELKEFPIADHDDGPDALEMAVRFAQEMLAGVPNDGLGHRLPVG
jgi:hypothetical protein